MIILKADLISVNPDQTIVVELAPKQKANPKLITAKLKDVDDYMFVRKHQSSLYRLELRGHFINATTMEVEHVRVC